MGVGTIPSPNDPSNKFMPSAIIGMTDEVTFFLIGDSRIMYGYDSPNDILLLVGEVGRSLGSIFATGNYGVGGEKIQNWATGQGAKRLTLAKYYSHVFCQHGVNDLGASRTAAQIKTDTLTVRALFPGKPFYRSTISPLASSTDGFATPGNQTTGASNAQRVLVNADIRKGNHGNCGFVEVADVMETARDSGIWNNLYTIDGTHPITLACKAVYDSGNFQRALQHLK